MKTLITLIIALLPIYIICLYVYKKDYIKEPKRILMRLFILGMISSIPAAILEYSIEPLFGKLEDMNLIILFIYVSISIALVEELFKWIVTYSISYNSKEFDELYDAIVYAVFVSRGFACIENIFYVLDAEIKTGMLRGITAIPAHAADAIIMGNYFGLAKQADKNNDKNLNKKYLLLSIILPTITHAIYDYCLLTQMTIFIIFYMFYITYLYIHCIKKIKSISSTKNNI